MFSSLRLHEFLLARMGDGTARSADEGEARIARAMEEWERVRQQIHKLSATPLEGQAESRARERLQSVASELEASTRRVLQEFESSRSLLLRARPPRLPRLRNQALQMLLNQ